MRRWILAVTAAALLPFGTDSAAAPQSSTLPYAISAPPPSYPLQAFRDRRSGTAILALDVDPKTGKVGRVRLHRSTGSHQLNRLAIKAATKWLFKPGTVTRLGVSVRFSPAGVVVGQNLVADRPHPFAGSITNVDPRAQTITVRGPRGRDLIAVGPETKFSRGGRPASLVDARVGGSVRGTAQVTSARDPLAITVELE